MRGKKGIHGQQLDDVLAGGPTLPDLRTSLSIAGHTVGRHCPKSTLDDAGSVVVGSPARIFSTARETCKSVA